MGDWFQTFTFPKVSKTEAPAAKENMMQALWSANLIQREIDQEAGLADKEVYRPTKAAAALSDDPVYFARHTLSLSVNGVAPRLGFCFNGREFDYINVLTCPSCGEELPFKTALPKICEAVEAFYDTGDIGPVICPECGEGADPRDWRSEPSLTFAYLSINFWNWPPMMDADGVPIDSWRISIPNLLSAAVGSPVRYLAAKL